MRGVRMQPVQSVINAIATLLANDTAILAPAVNANKVALIAAPFTPGPGLTLADLTLATFTGSAPLAGATGPQDVGRDPATGEQVITVIAPAGGWVFTCTVTPGSPQQIYGYALVDNGVANLLATALLPQPLTIAASGDFIDLGKVNFVLNAAPLS